MHEAFLNIDPDRLLNETEVSDITGLSVRTLQAWRIPGKRSSVLQNLTGLLDIDGVTCEPGWMLRQVRVPLRRMREPWPDETV